jgi:hypothetical protein
MYVGFNPSNINHELCHYTDDATCMLASTPATSTMNHELCHYTDDVTCMLASTPAIARTNSRGGYNYELCHPLLNGLKTIVRSNNILDRKPLTKFG